VLSAFLVAAGIIGYLGWTSTDADVPTSGYVAMALGVIFSLVVGVGLMALVFYSSRKGYDEPAVLIREPALHPDEVQTTSREKGRCIEPDGLFTRSHVANAEPSYGQDPSPCELQATTNLSFRNTSAVAVLLSGS
jgi:hypothetical protein